MKSFRKTLQESRLKTHHLIRSWLQPKLGAVGTKYRLAGRIRLANIWARKHPRRTFAYVTGSLVFLLVSTVAIDSMTLSDKREPDVSSIAQLEPVFAGFRTIQANKSIHRSTLTELTQEGQQLREELDSLIAIPRKSHQDSIQFDEHERKFTYYGTQLIKRRTRDLKRSMVTTGYIESVPRTRNNPHGLMITNWRTLENKDLDY